MLFTRKVYPTIDPKPEKQLIEELRRIIFEDSEEIDPRTCVVVALAHGTGLLRAHFERKSLKQRKQRLEKITSGDLIGGATAQAVEAAQAAQAAAIAAMAVTTTSAGAH